MAWIASLGVEGFEGGELVCSDSDFLDLVLESLGCLLGLVLSILAFFFGVDLFQASKK